MYSPQFRERAVALILDEGRRVADVARHLGVAEGSLYRWKQQALSGSRKRYINKQDQATHSDLVNRNFTAERENQLWCTDITEHPTREGKVYCCAVIDAYSRRIVGWAIDSRQTASLVLAALDMAIAARSPDRTVIHSDHGAQFTSWAFSRRITEAGLVGSMGPIGDGYDNAMIESFWSRMQIELLDRKKWKTRTELANAIFDYIETCGVPPRWPSAAKNMVRIDISSARVDDMMMHIN